MPASDTTLMTAPRPAGRKASRAALAARHEQARDLGAESVCAARHDGGPDGSPACGRDRRADQVRQQIAGRVRERHSGHCGDARAAQHRIVDLEDTADPVLLARRVQIVGAGGCGGRHQRVAAGADWPRAVDEHGASRGRSPQRVWVIQRGGRDGDDPLAETVRQRLQLGGVAAAGFRDTHGDALAASRVAMLPGGYAAAPAGATVAFEDVELAALLSDDLHRARFVARQLRRLATDDDEHARLRATLRVQMDDGEVQTYRTGNRHGSVACTNGTVCREDGTKKNADGSTTWTSACKDAGGTVWVIRKPSSSVLALAQAAPLR
jgi:hypothetical protein